MGVVEVVVGVLLFRKQQTPADFKRQVRFNSYVLIVDDYCYGCTHASTPLSNVRSSCGQIDDSDGSVWHDLSVSSIDGTKSQ